MPYSPEMKKAIGLVKKTLAGCGIVRQGRRFKEHGIHQPDPSAPLVLVACSGGRDSLALAYTAKIVCASLGVRCGAVIVDHHLQTGSGLVAQKAAEQCTAYGLAPVLIRRAQVHRTRAGLESDARDARFLQLISAAHDEAASVTLLAHTMSDQAETILFRFLRNPSITALAGMQTLLRREGVLFARPFLQGLTRQETTDLCLQAGIQWWDDPTNADNLDSSEIRGGGCQQATAGLPQRSRIRQILIPYMTDFTGSDLVSLWSSSAPVNQDDADFLDSQADEAYRKYVSHQTYQMASTQESISSPFSSFPVLKEDQPDLYRLLAQQQNQDRFMGGNFLSVYQLENFPVLHPALRRRILASIMGKEKIQPSATSILRLDDFLTGSKSAKISGNQAFFAVTLPQNQLLKDQPAANQPAEDLLPANRLPVSRRQAAQKQEEQRKQRGKRKQEQADICCWICHQITGDPSMQESLSEREA